MADLTGALGQFANAGAGLTKNVGALGQYSGTLGGIGNAAGIVGGVNQGGVSGYGKAAINTGSLAGKLGLLDKNSGTSMGLGDAANALSIYNGLKQGGVGGYAGAAVGAGQLGLNAGIQSGALSAAQAAPYLQGLNYAAIPLNLYNEVKNWQSGATGSDALAGAGTGASIGTAVLPGIGTAVGALLGGAAGALSSAFGNGKVAPENANWVGYTGAYNNIAKQGAAQGASPDQIAAAQQNMQSQVSNPYGALAGYFDLRNNQVKGNNPLYQQYGRMGEQKFTNDLVGQINDATKAGKIGPNDSASDIYSKVVQPWEDSWGKGQSTDSNKDAMQGLLTQMISQYEGGTASSNWLGRSGDKAFANLQSPGATAGPGGQTTANPNDLNAMAAAHDQQRAAMGIGSAGAQPAPAATPIAQVTQPQVGIQNMRRPVMARGGALSQVKRFDDGGPVHPKGSLSHTDFSASYHPYADLLGGPSPADAAVTDPANGRARIRVGDQRIRDLVRWKMLQDAQAAAANEQLSGPGMISRAKGGRARFDDGGDVGGDYDFSSQPSFDPGSVVDFNSLYNGGSGNDNTDFKSNLNDIQGQLDQSKFTNDQLGTWLDSYEANNPTAKPGALSQLAKNATGGSGLSGLLKAYAPLIPLVSGAINQRNTKAPTTAAGMTTSALTKLPTAHFGRTQNMAPTNNLSGSPMTPQDWYTYGSRPEASFYQNNGIPLNKTVVGQAKGGSTPEHSKNPGALGQATGVPEFNSAQQSYVGDGENLPGDGQSDDVPARLSKGEFVMDGHTVSMLGNGSNSAGAAKLEKLRQNLRKHAAQSNSKGKQFMHAKEPEQYMNQGKPKKAAAGAR